MSGAVWYTSDWHFGHLRAAEYRGFTTSEEHDEVVIANHNAVVEEDDVVWVLGDVCLRPTSLSTVARLKGRKRLIEGNHDQVWSGHSNSEKYLERWGLYFETIRPFATRKVDGCRFLLSHFPYTADRGKQRHTKYRLRDEGMPLVHGHLHVNEIYNRERPKQIHVGLDAWQLKPVPQEAVVSLIREVSGA